MPALTLRQPFVVAGASNLALGRAGGVSPNATKISENRTADGHRWTQIFKNHTCLSTPLAHEANNPQKSSLISVHPRPSAVKIPNSKSRLTGEVTIFYQIREILVALGVSPREFRTTGKSVRPRS